MKKKGADLILFGGKIWGGESIGFIPGIACANEKIIAIGEKEELLPLASTDTRIIDLKGRSVLPGFNDSHLHLIEGGLNLIQLDLSNVRSRTEFISRVAEYGKNLDKGDWILGGGWDNEGWDDKTPPTRELIDPVSRDNPLLLTRVDCHMSLANSYALTLAGIDEKTADPPGGAVIRDNQGKPTGILADTAQQLVWRVVPSPSEKKLLSAAKKALSEAARVGITSITENAFLIADTTRPADEMVRIYHRLLREGELTLRVNLWFPVEAVENISSLGIESGFGSYNLRIAGVKGFLDGSLGASSARFFKPYTDDPENRGILVTPPERMSELLKKAVRANLQPAVHAIGDEANHILLDIYQEILNENKTSPLRLRMEHAQHLTREDIARMGRLEIIASVQPRHAVDDYRFLWRKLGDERAKTSYPYRSLLEAGAPLAIGSDFPVAPLSPLISLKAAVVRKGEEAVEEWFLKERLPLSSALTAYTRGSAYATGEEGIKGELSLSKLADMVVLSDDIFKIPEEKIAELAVDYTIVGGRIVYSRGG
jgi:predicted amidohydrolase YtcJ